MSLETQNEIQKPVDAIDLLTKLPKKVSIGQKVAVAPISQFSVGKGQTAAFSFLDSAGTPFRLHYVKKPDGVDNQGKPKDKHLGSVHCSGSECCLREGSPSLYYFIPIIEYTVTGKEKGVTVYDEPFSFKFLKVKHSVWESKIAGLLESAEDPTNADFIVTLTPGREQYQDYVFNVKANVCKWRRNEKLNAEHARLVQYFDNVIEGLAGKHLTDDDLIAFYEGDENQQALAKASQAIIQNRVLPSANPSISIPSSIPTVIPDVISNTGVEVDDLDDFINA